MHVYRFVVLRSPRKPSYAERGERHDAVAATATALVVGQENEEN